MFPTVKLLLQYFSRATAHLPLFEKDRVSGVYFPTTLKMTKVFGMGNIS